MTDIPRLGLGTYGRTGDAGIAAILTAIEVGFRHIDTAQSYDTEAQVGAAIRESGLPRQEFFVTTKVADTQLRAADFMPSVRRSLDQLRMDQVDLLLIHWPSSKDAVPFEEYMLALKEAQDAGYARLIGVSNFNIDYLERARALLGDGALATNQIEIHPWLQGKNIVAHARKIGLQLTAYQPLVKGMVAEDEVLRRIAEVHGVAPAAIALAFLMAEGHAVIPASSSRVNLQANYAALSVQLTADEIAELRTLDRGYRHINPEKSPRWDD